MIFVDEPGTRDRRFMDLAANIGSWSKDRSAKTGCVIVGSDRLIRSTGFNGFVRGVNDDVATRHERPAKYSWTEHAERNAIYNAARIGMPLVGCTCYINWFPCIDCARAIVQVGIVRVVALEPDRTDAKWGAEFEFSLNMFQEVGLKFLCSISRKFALGNDSRRQKSLHRVNRSPHVRIATSRPRPHLGLSTKRPRLAPFRTPPWPTWPVSPKGFAPIHLWHTRQWS